MEKVGIILLFLMMVPAEAASDPFNNSTVLIINSGTEEQSTYHNLPWYPDEEAEEDLISSGKNARIKPSETCVPNYMMTLRYFPEGVKNCYTITLPDNKKYKYIFRAGFQYGNYDARSKPPTFDLLLDDQLWATVNTSANRDRPIFHEAYKLLPSNYEPIYGLVKNDTALRLLSRWNFGSHRNIGTRLLNTNCTTFANRPPKSDIKTVISSNNTSASIVYPFDFQSDDPLYAYFLFYLVGRNQSHSLSNNMKKLQIYVNGEAQSSAIHKLKIGEKKGLVVTMYPVLVQGTTNVTISAIKKSSWSLIIEAIDVYEAMKWVMEHSQSLSGGFQFNCSFVAVLCLHLLHVLVFFAY